MNEAASVGIIGGADGPTAIFVTGMSGAVTWLLAGLLLGLNILAAVRFKKKPLYAYAMAVADILVLDAWTKFWTVMHLALGERRAFIPGLFSLTHVHNYGAAWSSFSGERWLLIIATSLGMAAIVYLLVRIVRHPLGTWGLLAVLGGGLGNLWNRVVFGFVIDMIDLDFMEYPVFNVADIFVVCGAIVSAAYYLCFYEKCDARNWEKTNGNEDASSN